MGLEPIFSPWKSGELFLLFDGAWWKVLLSVCLVDILSLSFLERILYFERPLGWPTGFEPVLTESQPAVLPLHYGHHIEGLHSEPEMAHFRGGFKYHNLRAIAYNKMLSWGFGYCSKLAFLYWVPLVCAQLPGLLTEGSCNPNWIDFHRCIWYLRHLQFRTI